MEGLTYKLIYQPEVSAIAEELASLLKEISKSEYISSWIELKGITSLTGINRCFKVSRKVDECAGVDSRKTN